MIRGSAVHLTSAPVGSDEWAQARRERINGSEIAAVLGVSPYESPFSLWHRKAGNLGAVVESDVMYWGTQLEPVVRAEWNRRHPDQRVRATGQWAHRERGWQGGSPDGLGRRRLWEAKTAYSDDGWGEPGSDEVPVHYRAQTLWYLDVFGWSECDLSVLISGSDYREYLIRHDPAELQLMRDQAQKFLTSLAAGAAPPLDGHEATYQAVRELHPDIEPIDVELPDDIGTAYVAALAGEKAAAVEKRRAAALVLDAMGSARTAWWAGRPVARRQAKSTDGAIPYLVAAKGAADRHNSPKEIEAA